MLQVKDQFLIELLECGILDLQFFSNLLEKLADNNLYLDTQSVVQEYWGIKLNIFISEALYLLAEWFLKKYKYKIEELLNIGDLERYREENDELYEVFINLLDSHLWFHNDKIELLFKNSEFYYL